MIKFEVVNRNSKLEIFPLIPAIKNDESRDEYYFHLVEYEPSNGNQKYHLQIKLHQLDHRVLGGYAHIFLRLPLDWLYKSFHSECRVIPYDDFLSP